MSGEKKEEFWDNGNPRSRKEYVDGRLHGLSQEWYENGTKSSETTYVDGKRHGLYQCWYGDGAKLCEVAYVDGKQHGLFEGWDHDGTKSSEYTFVNGSMDGPCKVWRGSKSYSGEFKNNIIIRVISISDPKGRECVLPLEGEFIAWKACKTSEGENVYVRLIVPKEARRITPFDNMFKYKARIDYAIVNQIIDKDGKEYKEASSFVFRGKRLIYKIGETVRADGFNDKLRDGCGAGINVHLHKDHCDQWF